MKPTTPLLAKIAPKTGVSGLQWCHRFHRRQSTRQQRRWRFHVSCRPTGERQQSAVEGTGGTGGPGCGARGRWPGLAGLRDDAPSHTSATKRHCCGGSRRVRRARVGFEIDHSEPLGSRVAISRAAGPDGARNTSGATRPPGYAKGAGTEVPAPLSAHSATASSRLRPNDPQSWRRRRIHRNIPPTTAAPRPAPPIRPSKPVRARR